ncbi:MAG TPA: hypothetical protein VGK73_30555 [Polyangiaceae bacterium]
MPSARFRRALSAASLFAPLLLACQAGPPPDLVRLELPELVTSTDPVRPTVHVRRGGTSSVAAQPVALSIVPPEVASIGKDGTLACLKSGDAKVFADVQGVKDDAPLRCRLVERLELGELPVFDVSGPPVTLSVRAVAKGGAELADVPFTLTTDSPRVLKASALTLTPQAVGETSVSVRAGTKERREKVRVVRSIDVEALPLEGGRRIYFSLTDGKYEVEVTLPSDKTLSVEWRGAPYCSYRGSGRVHRSTCTLQGKGGAVVDSPAFLLDGSTDVSKQGIKLREVP